MELYVAILFIGISVGAIGGMFIISRHIESEVEQAYLIGHLDGYRKAEDDSGEVFE